MPYPGAVIAVQPLAHAALIWRVLLNPVAAQRSFATSLAPWHESQTMLVFLAVVPVAICAALRYWPSTMSGGEVK